LNIPELSASIRQPDADTRCYCALQGPYTLRPYHWVRTPSAGYGNDQTEVTNYWIVYKEKDNVADYDGGFDCHC